MMLLCLQKYCDGTSQPKAIIGFHKCFYNMFQTYFNVRIKKLQTDISFNYSYK